jgi:hypothetical protein
MNTWLNQQSLATIGIILVAGMVLALLVGRRLELWFVKRFGDLPEGTSTLISAIFALTAFLLGFAFNMSNNRYEQRRQNIVEEANAIGTAMMRIDLYPDSLRPILKSHFDDYIAQRIAFFKVGPQFDSAIHWEAEASKSGDSLWQIATRYGRDTKDIIATSQMIPALNAMFDAASSRHYGLIAKVPEPVLYLLFLLAFTSAFLAGFNSPKEKVNYFVSTIFCLMTVLVILLVFDLDRPRRGLVRFDDTHKAIESLQTTGSQGQ